MRSIHPIQNFLPSIYSLFLFSHRQSTAIMSYTSLILLSLTIAVNGFSMQMASSTSTKPYGVNVKLSIKPERREDFLTIVQNNQKQTLDLEPAALQYVVGEDVDSPNTFYIHEQFTRAEGFDAHRATPHNGDWAKFKESEPFADGGDPVIDFYYGDHEPEEVPLRPAFCLNVELCIKPEIREEFLEVIRNNEKGSNGKEPLCLQYVWGESTEEDNKFLFHEEYTGEDGGKEGFDAHTKAPHFKKWEEFVEKDPFTKEPVVYFFRTI